MSIISPNIIKEAESELSSVKPQITSNILDNENILYFESDGISCTYEKQDIPFIDFSIKTTVCWMENSNENVQPLIRIGNDSEIEAFSILLSNNDFKWKITDCEIDFIPDLINKWIYPLFSIPKVTKSIIKEDIKEKKSSSFNINKWKKMNINVLIHNWIIRFGKNIHCTNSLSFLIPNLTVTSKASTIQSNLSNLQILIEDTVNPSENHFLVKDFGYSLSINSPSNTQFSIDLNFKPIQLRLFRLKEATEYISHAYKGFLDIQSSPKLQKHELEVKINNTQKSKKSLHIFERLLRKTDGIEFKFSVKIASIFAAIEDYCWKTRELQMILQSGIDSKQNIHSFSFSLSITNTMIATFVKHGAVQLFQDQLFTSIEGDDFLKFNWKVNQSPDSLAISHILNISIGPYQSVLWMPAFLDIIQLFTDIRRLFVDIKDASIPKSNHVRSPSWKASKQENIIIDTPSERLLSRNIHDTETYHSFIFNFQMKRVQLIIPASFSENRYDILFYTQNSADITVRTSNDINYSQSTFGWKISDNILPITFINFGITGVNAYTASLNNNSSIRPIEITAPLPNWLSPILPKPISMEAETNSNPNSWGLLDIQFKFPALHFSLSKSGITMIVATILSLKQYFKLFSILIQASGHSKGLRTNSSPSLNKPIDEMIQGNSIAIGINIPDFEIHLLDNESKDFILVQLQNNRIALELGKPYRIDGSIQDIKILSYTDDNIHQLIGRDDTLLSPRENSPRKSKPKDFISLQSSCDSELTSTTIVISFTPCFISLDSILAGLLVNYFSLSFSDYIKCWRIEHCTSIFSTCKEIIRSKYPNVSVKKEIITKPSWGASIKIVMPWFNICMTAEPIMRNPSNNVYLEMKIVNLFLYYSSLQDDATLSSSSIQLSIGRNKNTLFPIFSPAIQGTVILQTDIHDKSFFRKRVFVVKADIPLLSIQLAVPQIQLARQLFEHYIKIFKNDKKKSTLPKLKDKKRGIDDNLSTAGEASIGELKEEGLILETELNVRPQSNYVSVSDDNSNEKWMAWRYIEPRAIREVKVQPIPSLAEIGAWECNLELQYFDIFHQEYRKLCQWKGILDSEKIITFKVPEMKQRKHSCEWKIIANPFPVPSSVLPVICLVPSYYSNQFSNVLTLHTTCHIGKITMLCSSPNKENVTEELFSIYLQKTAFQSGYKSRKLELGFQSIFGIQYVESRFLTNQWAIEPSLIGLYISKENNNIKNSIHISASSKTPLQLNISPPLITLLQKIYTSIPRLTSPNSNVSPLINRQYCFINRTINTIYISQWNEDRNQVCGPITTILPNEKTWFSWTQIFPSKIQVAVLSLKNIENNNEWSSSFSIDNSGWKEVILPIQNSNGKCWIYVSTKQTSEGTWTSIQLLGSCVFENLSRIPIQLHLNETKSSKISSSQPHLIKLPNIKGKRIRDNRLESMSGIFMGDPKENIEISNWQFYSTVISESSGPSEWQWTKNGIDIPKRNQIINPTTRILIITRTDDELCLSFICTMSPYFVLPSKEGPMSIRFSPLFEFENLIPHPISFILENNDKEYKNIIEESSLISPKHPITPQLPISQDSKRFITSCRLEIQDESIKFNLFTDKTLTAIQTEIITHITNPENDVKEEKKEIIHNIMDSKEINNINILWYFQRATRSTIPIIKIAASWKYRISNWTNHNFAIKLIENEDIIQAKSQETTHFHKITSLKLGIYHSKDYIIWNDMSIVLTGSAVARRIHFIDKEKGSYSFVAKTILHAGCFELVLNNGHFITNESNYHLNIAFASLNSHSKLKPNDTISFAGPWNSNSPHFSISLDTNYLKENSISHWCFPITLLPHEFYSRNYINLPWETKLDIENSIYHSMALGYSTCNDNEKYHMVLFEDKQSPVIIKNNTDDFILTISPLHNDIKQVFVPFSVLPNDETKFSVYCDNIESIKELQINIQQKDSNDILEYYFELDLLKEKTQHFNINDKNYLLFSCERIGKSSILTLKSKSMESNDIKNTLSFNIKASTIGLCFIDDRISFYPTWQEVLDIYLDGLKLSYSQEESIRTIRLSLEGYQFDNSLGTEQPVICYPKIGENRVLDAIIILQEVSSIVNTKCISLSMKPFVISSDDIFVFRCMNTLQYFSSLIQYNAEKIVIKQNENISKTSSLTKGQLKKLQTPIIYIESLNIDEIYLMLSIAMTVGVFVSLDKTPIRFPSLILKNKSYQPSELAVLLTETYFTSTIYRVPQILASFELIGNPGQLIREFSTAIEQLVVHPLHGFAQGPSQLLEGFGLGISLFLVHSSQGAFSSIRSIANSISRNLDVLTFDKEYQEYRKQERSTPALRADQKIIKGVKGFSYGVAMGMFGVVSQPVSGGYQSGVSGFMQGLGKGLLGAVAKPVGGAADLISFTTDAIIQTVSGNSSISIRKKPRQLLLSGELPLSNLQIACGIIGPNRSVAWLVNNIDYLNDEELCFATSIQFKQFPSSLFISKKFIYILPYPHPESPELVKLPISSIFSCRQVIDQTTIRIEALNEINQILIDLPNPVLRIFVIQILSQLK